LGAGDLKILAEWSEYQEETARFFRSIGLEAETNVRLQGVRTVHDIDVVVRSNHVGFDLLWIIECKHMKATVSKLHVLALREIVADLGADRGILVSETGFQSGAREAANLTSVQLTSLAELKSAASDAIGLAQLRSVHDRIIRCRQRYWDIEKEDRIDFGLRPDTGGYGYSGNAVIHAVEAALFSAFADKYPINSDDPDGWSAIHFVDRDIMSARSHIELSECLEPLVTDLENRLDTAEAGLSGRSGPGSVSSPSEEPGTEHSSSKRNKAARSDL
jgi:hypothetical protein